MIECRNHQELMSKIQDRIGTNPISNPPTSHPLSGLPFRLFEIRLSIPSTQEPKKDCLDRSLPSYAQEGNY